MVMKAHIVKRYVSPASRAGAGRRMIGRRQDFAGEETADRSSSRDMVTGKGLLESGCR